MLACNVAVSSIPNQKSTHCPLCTFSTSWKAESNSKTLFLGIERLLTTQGMGDIVGSVETQLKDRFRPIELDEAAMDCLEDLIEKVQEICPIYIVICSNLRNYFTLNEVRELFKDYPKIQNVIIGKTASEDYDNSPEYREGYRFETEAEMNGIEFISIGGDIKHWLHKHQIEENEKKFAVLNANCDYRHTSAGYCFNLPKGIEYLDEKLISIMKQFFAS